jgi:hypothetical protein
MPAGRPQSPQATRVLGPDSTDLGSRRALIDLDAARVTSTDSAIRVLALRFGLHTAVQALATVMACEPPDRRGIRTWIPMAVVSHGR